MGSRVGMDRMSGTEEDLVVEVEEEEEEDGETYFRTEHVSRTEELQEEVDMATKVGKKSFIEIYLLIFPFFRRFPYSLSFLVSVQKNPCNATPGAFFRGLRISKLPFLP